MYGNFEVRFSFSIRQRIDYLNAHKATHPLAADMDIVGGLHIVKLLILCKLRADTVGRHRFTSAILFDLLLLILPQEQRDSLRCSQHGKLRGQRTGQVIAQLQRVGFTPPISTSFLRGANEYRD
mgnify:CR=1 FL=1